VHLFECPPYAQLLHMRWFVHPQHELIFHKLLCLQ
jgi:hypothetical protein